MHNLYDLSKLESGTGEIVETILAAGDFRIERIITLTPYSGPGEWYDQGLDEWVVLLQGTATLEFESGEKTELQSGDHIFIPAHKIHRVSLSSPDVACIWLAIHGKFK